MLKNTNSIPGQNKLSRFLSCQMKICNANTSYLFDSIYDLKCQQTNKQTRKVFTKKISNCDTLRTGKSKESRYKIVINFRGRPKLTSQNVLTPPNNHVDDPVWIKNIHKLLNNKESQNRKLLLIKRYKFCLL